MPYGIQTKAIHGTAMALEVYLLNNWLQESIPIMRMDSMDPEYAIYILQKKLVKIRPFNIETMV